MVSIEHLEVKIKIAIVVEEPSLLFAYFNNMTP